MVRYFVRVGVAISVLMNVILGGKSNQTFSARNWEWKMSKRPNLVWLIDTVFWNEENHCKESWVYWNMIQVSQSKYFSEVEK